MYNNTNSFKYRQCSDILSSHVNFHEMLKEISRVAEQKFALGAGACVTVGFVVVDRLDVDQGIAEPALLELVEDVHTPVLLHHVLVHVDPCDKKGLTLGPQLTGKLMNLLYVVFVIQSAIKIL